jgi:hypothetical protein
MKRPGQDVAAVSAASSPSTIGGRPLVIQASISATETLMPVVVNAGVNRDAHVEQIDGRAPVPVP